MHRQRIRSALVLVAALLPFGAWAQNSAVLRWQHDGLNVTGFAVYMGPSPDALRPHTAAVAATARSYEVLYVPDGVSYYALTALNGPAIESARSNVACAATPGYSCPAPISTVPGPVRNLVVTVLPTPAALTITVSQNGDTFTWNAAGTGQVRIQLQPVGALIDWFRVGGSNGANVPATPTVNANGDGVSANAITAALPFSGAQMDVDGSDVTGILVTYAGVAKAMIRSGTTWAVTF